MEIISTLWIPQMFQLAGMNNELYLKLSSYQNFFQPVMRLKEKIRNGLMSAESIQKPKLHIRGS